MKVGNNADGSVKSVTYHSSDLLSFTRFLDIHYKTWTYFNVYLVKTGDKVGQFTKFNKPQNKWISEQFAG
ncbi:MAG: hypothetical protein WAU36_04295 [Cyclobacteriaceae bacterium]